MKSKRRTVNSDVNLCRKKIITRNMQSKIAEETSISVTTNNVNFSTSKPSPNTRAKSGSVAKVDSDPYSFSKMDEECKLPTKKIKIVEKNGKDAAVNTCNFATMTDPELLGPCEPGTSIELQGIVWLETVTGLLVINVTWRGRTYVGTLMDSTKYEFTPPLISQDFSGKFENRPNNRPNRAKKRFVPSNSNCHSSLRSNNVRQSRRLSESLSYFGSNKKVSARLALNGSCYVDSLSVSADASNSGESDSELNNYQKYSLGSKTRSVTRSLAKQNKFLSNDNDSNSAEIDNFNIMKKCSQLNCFKKFGDATALRYHLQRSHGVFEDDPEYCKSDDGKPNNISEWKIKIVDTYVENNHIGNTNGIRQHLIGTKEKITTESKNFEFNSDSEVEKYKEQLKFIKNEPSVIAKEEAVIVTDHIFVPSEKPFTTLSELPIHLSGTQELLSFSGGPEKSSDSSLKEMECFEPQFSSMMDERPQKHSLIPDNPTSLCMDSSFISGSMVFSPNTMVRTITAPIVSIPFETSPMTTSTAIMQSSTITPALIKPKPLQSPTSLPHNSQSKKLKPSKKSSHCSGSSSLTSFQVPSSNTLSKKRALIPLKVSVNHTSGPSRVSSSPSTLNVTSPNHSCRHIKSSTFLNVTPILPATSTSTILNTIISNSITSPGHNPNNGSSQSNTKRTVTTPNNVSPLGMTSLLSLKPIQPKPKSTSIVTSFSNSVPSTFPNPLPTTNISTLVSSQAPYQRQILPSPVSKSENSCHSDERILRKVDSVKTASIKKKRRKSEKKMRLNLHKCNRLNMCELAATQLKHDSDFKDHSLCVDNYKMDEENSHSPEYSDLSETNDTPAPILEKEIELKSGDCDKLVICTEFETTFTNRVSASCQESYDDTKDCLIYNKPPALLPAVLRTDLLNRSTNDLDTSDSTAKIMRRKTPVHKKSLTSVDGNKDISKGHLSDNSVTFGVEMSALGHDNISTSMRRSFQSSQAEEKPSQSIASISKDSLYSSPPNEKNSKIKLANKCSNLSAINDYVWRKKNNHDLKAKGICKFDEDSTLSKGSNGEDSNKKKVFSSNSQPSNGRFSVHALTSPQEIVSRSITTSSTVISLNPNTRLENTLYKN